MELYPIKKMLQQQQRQQRSRKSETLLQSDSQMLTPNTSHIGFHRKDHSLSPLKHESPNISALISPKNFDDPSRRYDRKFTLSWASKQNERRKDHLRLTNILPAIQKPTPNSGSTSPVPLTKKNRSFVPHLGSEQDEELYKVPLYKNEVFDIRNQNERIMKQIVSTKANYSKGLNDIAEQNRFKHFRSYTIGDSNTASKMMNRSSQLTHQHSNFTFQSQESDEEPLSATGNKSLSPTGKRNTLDALSCSTVQSYDMPEKPGLLEGLEEIYQQDLLKRIHNKGEVSSLSPVKNRHPKGKNFDLNKNYKNYFEDDVLMDKLRDPYGKMLPFKKPIMGNIRHEKIRELNAIETKAEVLRNIKTIEESMIKDATAMGSLQKIPEMDNEETRRDSVKVEAKQAEKVNLKDLKGKSDKEKRDLRFLALYMKKK